MEISSEKKLIFNAAIFLLCLNFITDFVVGCSTACKLLGVHLALFVRPISRFLYGVHLTIAMLVTTTIT